MIYTGIIMIRKPFCTWRICSLLAALFFIVPVSLHAQKRDFTTWASTGFKYKVNPAFTLSGKLEWRTKDDLDKTDRWGLEAGGAYSVLPFLKIAAGYEVHYRNREEAGWKFRHRYHFDGTLSTRVHRLKVSLRERFQHTFDSNNDELRWRSRVKLAYDIPKCKIEPYASVEMYNGLNRGEKFDVQRMRYRGGVVLPLSSDWEADVFYCRQWESQARKDIVGVLALILSDNSRITAVFSCGALFSNRS